VSASNGLPFEKAWCDYNNKMGSGLLFTHFCVKSRPDPIYDYLDFSSDPPMTISNYTTGQGQKQELFSSSKKRRRTLLPGPFFSIKTAVLAHFWKSPM
jgi:hypothetical protein